jgi:hypothetical protein
VIAPLTYSPEKLDELRREKIENILSKLDGFRDQLLVEEGCPKAENV